MVRCVGLRTCLLHLQRDNALIYSVSSDCSKVSRVMWHSSNSSNIASFHIFHGISAAARNAVKGRRLVAIDRGIVAVGYSGNSNLSYNDCIFLLQQALYMARIKQKLDSKYLEERQTIGLHCSGYCVCDCCNMWLNEGIQRFVEAVCERSSMHTTCEKIITI